MLKLILKILQSLLCAFGDENNFLHLAVSMANIIICPFYHIYIVGFFFGDIE